MNFLRSHELHSWVAALVAVVGSFGWLHDSIVRVYGNEAALGAHQEHFKDEQTQQRTDIRALQTALANCNRGNHE
jgi:hypothetical protein